jgi:hypothetical protein
MPDATPFNILAEFRSYCEHCYGLPPEKLDDSQAREIEQAFHSGFVSALKQLHDVFQVGFEQAEQRLLAMQSLPGGIVIAGADEMPPPRQ